MHLIVIASASAQIPDQNGSWVLRLAGTPRFAEIPPPHILTIVDRAAARVREEFPEWLWQWISTHGALDLETFSGVVSWWWYTPLSEKSPLRSRVIREFYWLTLLRLLFETYEITGIDWFGDDGLIAEAAARVAADCNLPFTFKRTEGRRPRRSQALMRRALYSMFVLARFILIKTVFWGAEGTSNAVDTILYTRFPVLWERRQDAWRERMFGTWPDHLSAHQKRFMYAAVCSASFTELVGQARLFRKRCRSQNISILEGQLSLITMLGAQLTLRLFWRYLRWRRQERKTSVKYDGFEVTELFWRELDFCVLSSEIPFDLTIAAGIRAVLLEHSTVRTIFLPFEYQPMERAVWAGAKSARDVTIVGVQTGLFESNQMGFSFPINEVKQDNGLDQRSPVPDVLAAYGELPYRIFVERLGENRVCLSGPIRYSHLQAQGLAEQSLREAFGLPDTTIFILVTTSISPEESTPLLDAAFNVAAERPDVFLLLKFHYHLPLHTELREVAARYGVTRYRVFDSDLYRLMREARVTICAGSSVGIEAIAFGCMPVVFRSLGEMSSNPMLDVPDAVFFWHSISELRSALQSCLEQDEKYQQRKSRWPQAIRDHLFDLNASPDERLYEFLNERAIS